MTGETTSSAEANPSYNDQVEESLGYEWLDGLSDFQPSESLILLRLYLNVTSTNKQAIDETCSLSIR